MYAISIIYVTSKNPTPPVQSTSSTLPQTVDPAAVEMTPKTLAKRYI